MQDSNRISNRLNARWQTDWVIEDQAENLNSIARPYDQQAFRPPGDVKNNEHVCMCVCAYMHACIYVCLFACMYVYMYVYRYIFEK